MDREKIAWMITLCVVAFALVGPVNRLSRAIESAVDSYRESCILPGTIPDRPDSSKGWRLKWVQTHKERK